MASYLSGFETIVGMQLRVRYLSVKCSAVLIVQEISCLCECVLCSSIHIITA